MKRFELAIAGGGLTAARATSGTARPAEAVGRALLRRNDPPLSPPSTLEEVPARRDNLDPTRRGRGVLPRPRRQGHAGKPVTSIHTTARMLTTGGAPFGYKKLLIATGAKPRRLNVRGVDLPGVFPLRTVQNSTSIVKRPGWAEKAVVVGGGFIGMEVAASLRKLGLAVTMIHVGGGLFDQLGSEQLGADLLALYREQGVDVWLEEEVAGFGGDDNLGTSRSQAASASRPTWPSSASGSCRTPTSSAAAGSRRRRHRRQRALRDQRARRLRRRRRRQLPRPALRRQRRIEHWSNADYQGTEVGKILAGHGDGYDTVSWFFTEVFGLTIKVFGDVSRHENVRPQGSLGAGELLAVYGHNGGLVGAVAVGQSEDVETALEDLIRAHEPDALSDDLAGQR